MKALPASMSRAAACMAAALVLSFMGTVSAEARRKGAEAKTVCIFRNTAVRGPDGRVHGMYP